MSISLPYTGPFEAIAAIREVLAETRGLTPDDAILGSRVQPSALGHKSFRLDMVWFAFDGGSMRPGDVLNHEERIIVHFSHDLGPADHDAALREAVDDLYAAVDALLSSARTRGKVRLNGSAGTRKIVGHCIETDLPLSIKWSTTVPSRQT